MKLEFYLSPLRLLALALFWTWSNLAPLAAFSQIDLFNPTTAKPIMTIYEKSTGDFCRNERTTTYLFDDLGDLRTTAGKTIYLSDLKELVLLIENSQRYPTLNFDVLGVSREAYDQHRQYLWINNAPAPSYEEYCSLVAAVVKGPTWSTSHLKSNLTIPAGIAGNSEQIELKSEHLVPLMLPWDVKIGNRSWTTFYPDLPRKISELLEKGSPSSCVMNNSDYWSSPVWGSYGLTRLRQ
jgi:hypothetical protein